MVAMRAADAEACQMGQSTLALDNAIELLSDPGSLLDNNFSAEETVR